MLSRLFRSFAIGFVGLAHVTRRERNMAIHVAAAGGVVAAGAAVGLAPWEWASVIGCIGLVWAAECFNTAIERLADRVTPDRDPLIKEAKDASAAGVLVLAIMSAVVGGIIFIPRLLARAWG